MNKKLITSAVVGALALPGAALAAIDDQGMQYVTAAEGLHGSLRVDMLIDTDEEDRDFSSEENSLRLWINGTSDLGGGLKSTYYWEWRNSEVDDGELGTQAWDIGLEGPFGDLDFGYLAMTGFRLTPSADLAFERGSERASPSGDPVEQGVRYETPVINGVQFGISGVLDGSKEGTPDGSLDQYAVAAKYTLPIGLEVGAAYENVKKHIVDSDSQFGVAKTLTEERSPSEGYRFGMRYGQDNWLLAYEFRTYDAFSYVNGIETAANGGFQFVDSGGNDPADDDYRASFDHDDDDQTPDRGFITNGNDDLTYNVHAFGAQVKLDRITMTANYSTEETELAADITLTDDTAGQALTKTKYTFDRDTIAVDAAYALGARSWIVLGWKNVDEPSGDSKNGDNYVVPGADGVEYDDVSTTFLFYRVDF